MDLPEVVRSSFLRLPAGTRRSVLSALGKRSPWDHRFDHKAPASAPGLLTGPPDVIGVGVQKAGTTWWHSLIAKHPGFYDHPGFHKERHFFSRFWGTAFGPDDEIDYHRWFPRPAGRLTGEWTPDYLHQHWVPALLHRAAPQAKLLVMLRDPVERYRSGLAHHVEHDRRVTPMMASDAFGRGFSFDALGRLEGLYGSDAILVLQYEACKDDPGTHLAATFRFLGLDDDWHPKDLGAEVNRTSAPKPPLAPGQRRELCEQYSTEMARLAGRYPAIDLDRWPSASVVTR